MTVQEARKQFPELSGKVYGKDLVYFDNAATSQRPRSVVEKLVSMNESFNANIHRAVHYVANVATEEYENARESVRCYINAATKEEVVFTSGTTASINLVAYSFGEAFVGPGDEILVSEAEHHSNIVPWQLLCERKHAVLKVIKIDDDGYLDLDSLRRELSERTKLVAVTHISNVLGLINPVKEVVRICHEKNVPVLVDGAQGIVHQVVDVQAIDCDFYVFSGHKLYASTGTGVLFGKKRWLESMPPFLGGGEMIETVKFSGTTYAPLPEKFEAGTPNFGAVPTFVPALNVAGMLNERDLSNYCEGVKDYLLDALTSNQRIRLFGVPRRTEDKISLFSFSVDGVHHEDLALILDKMGIAVRSGQMCAEPLMDRFGVTGMLRASLAPYNTMEEAEYFVKSLDRAIGMLA